MTENLAVTMRSGVVAIGRNEGERFYACIRSLPKGLPVVYVDSGSTDDSVGFAREHGVAVVELPPVPGFTAARARNAGWRRLLDDHPDLTFVQFIDGDCALDPEWMDKAVAALMSEADLAVVFGRRRERFPEASLYNAQCDHEWNVPVGEARACGGDALMRVEALRQTGGYDNRLIAGEEPDLCLRMRRLGWHIRRIDAEMTVHDARILRLPAWWKRARRAGYAYIDHLWRNRGESDPDWTRQVMSMVLWAAAFPMVALLGLVLAWAAHPGWLAVPPLTLLLYGLQYRRLVKKGLRNGESADYARGDAGLMVLAKFAHLAGAAGFFMDKIRGKGPVLIEYK